MSLSARQVRLPRTVTDAIGVFAFRSMYRRFHHRHDPLGRFVSALIVSARPIPQEKEAIQAAIELYRRITPRIRPATAARLAEIEEALELSRGSRKKNALTCGPSLSNLQG